MILELKMIKQGQNKISRALIWDKVRLCRPNMTRDMIKNVKTVIFKKCQFMQVRAVEMYGAAHTDLAKSETTWDIKIIITHHLYIYKSCVFTQNLEGVTQKISLPCPWEVWNGQGHGRLIFQTTPFKFCGKFTLHEILNW